MYRHGDLVAESKVIQHVDSEEHHDVRKPSNQWDSSFFHEEWRVGGGEVRRPCKESRDNELDESDKETAIRFLSVEMLVRAIKGATQDSLDNGFQRENLGKSVNLWIIVSGKPSLCTNIGATTTENQADHGCEWQHGCCKPYKSAEHP